MNPTRRRLVSWLAGLSLLAVVGVVVFGRTHIAERWYIWQLESDKAPVVNEAATRLAELNSLRAILPLIQQVPREISKGRDISRVFGRVHGPDYWTDSAVISALHALCITPEGQKHLEATNALDELAIPPGEKAYFQTFLTELIRGKGQLTFSKNRPQVQGIRTY